MGACCCKEEDIDFDAEVELSHFHLLRSVGKGAFGKVRVVQHKHSKILYALKYINKAKCIKMRAVENIIQERRLLEEIEYPLICNLRYAFQDDENMFMVLDLMLGGDLRFHLERQGNMREEVVKFYVAEVSLGLAYLHSKKIVHRDLKPDNVLLDEKGHAHLTDFNIAVHYNERKPLTSIAGSMAYMAPEVLTKKGYFDSVDWWSLGVVMYELLFSKRPFRGKTNSALTSAILNDSLHFPDNVRDMVSDECIDCLKQFCERDISKRLGCGPNGLENIKRHPWFHNIEWDKLDTKQAKPPFIPDSKRANFDATHELEELLLEDNPLKAKKRANHDINELSKEMRIMEEKFLIYDFTKMHRRRYYNNSSATTSEKIQKTLRRSESRSYASSTAIDSSSNQNYSNMDTSSSPLPTHPPLAHTRTESDLTAVGYVEESNEKIKGDVKGDWLNEKPASPLKRDNGRTSSSDSDNFSTKLYNTNHILPPSSVTVPTIQENNKRNISSFSPPIHMTSSLSPPPRIQTPAQKMYNNNNNVTPPSSLPSSPSLNPVPSQLSRNLSLHSGHPITPSQLPPPNLPLPPTPNLSSNLSLPPLSNDTNSIVNNNNNNNDTLNTSRNNSFKVRNNLLKNEPSLNEISSESDNYNNNGSFGGVRGNGLNDKGHYRNLSEVSNKSSALSVVGVHTGI